ncbi:alpha/beta hydrolase [Hasllibacter halocynthiae]|uniref:alpha/beta hydrolase n=1 Tax=Hasllibacter halocynthiae TaxID=595589 RepID=UPI001FE44E9B|nr:alpha/beta-hydrolase family protein [Hasllibacter halocynthiae]
MDDVDGVTRLHLLAVPLALALLFFAASLTPSLVPRSAIFQGVLGGLVGAIGYVIGRILAALWHFLGLPQAEGRSLAFMRFGVLAVPAGLAIWCLALVTPWQDSVRAAVGMEPVTAGHPVVIVVLAVIVFLVLLLLGRAVARLFRWLRRRFFPFMPRRVANGAAALLAALLVLIVTRDGMIDTLFGAADSSYATAAGFFEADLPAPSDPLVPGGPGSLLDWGALGAQGRQFVTRGPTQEEIAAFLGRPAKRPLRIYAGLETAPSAEARAALALAELERVGGFERANLVVTMPTGTGWLDEGSHAPLEYLAEGDVATVVVQYSYLTSPLTLIFETQRGLEQSDALTQAVLDRWRAMDPATRPRLFLHGLSLGAWASMYSVDLLDMVSDPVDGALWAGPPFPSELWRRAVARRDAGSPYVLPVIADGRTARFTNQLVVPGTEGWGAMRIVWLQYASDGVVFFEPASTWRRPVWMAEPPAHDVSPELRWMPVVTLFQLALDMAIATSVPDGYGHNYIARDYIPAWQALLDPAGWTEEDVLRLQRKCTLGLGMGCDPRPE